MALFSFMKKEKEVKLKAFLSGKLIPIEEVNDGVFSAKMLGEGVAIEPDSEELVAPADGEIAVVMENSFHAVGINLTDGTQILLHIGLDTVKMNGDGFICHVKSGDKVKCGQKLISFDKNKIKEAGYRDVTMLVITEPEEKRSVKFIDSCDVTAGETVISA